MLNFVIMSYATYPYVGGSSDTRSRYSRSMRLSIRRLTMLTSGTKRVDSCVRTSVMSCEWMSCLRCLENVEVSELL